MSGLHPVGGAPVGSGGVVAAADSGATLVEVVDSFMLADTSAPTAREVLVSGVSLSAALVTHLKFLASDGPFYGGGVDVGGYIRVGESFVMSDIAASKATFYNEVVDGFSLKDLCGIVYRLLISDGFSMTDSVEERARKLIAVVDTLLAADLVTSKLSAVYVLASAFAAEDVAARTLREEITDAVVISELLEKALRGYHAIVEPIVMADSATMRARFTIPLVDGVTIADSADSKGILLQAIVDGVGFAAALDIEDGHYYAWVVDAESRAAWKYDNYGFNSMAQF